MTARLRIDRSFTPEAGGRPAPIRFCTRCGRSAEQPPSPPHGGRVCARCGMGLMLSCSQDALPGGALAFLIATFDLTVSAVSEAAERIFGPERSLLGRPVLEFVGSPLGDDQLALHVGRAAQRTCDPVELPVRLHAGGASERVGTMAARISSCAPPRAALVAVEPSGFGRR